MGKGLTSAILSVVLAASATAPVYAASTSHAVPSVKQDSKVQPMTVDTSWKYEGITITVNDTHKLLAAEKKKYEQLTDMQVLKKGSGTSPNVSVSGGSSWYLISDQEHTFDNSDTYNAIYGAVSAIITAIVAPQYMAAQVAAGGATSVMSGHINDWLGINPIVYTDIRSGFSFDSYMNYYEYVDSLVRYSDSSFSTPTSVEYDNTQTEVPNEELAYYGLQNP